MINYSEQFPGVSSNKVDNDLHVRIPLGNGLVAKIVLHHANEHAFLHERVAAKVQNLVKGHFQDLKLGQEVCYAEPGITWMKDDLEPFKGERQEALGEIYKVLTTIKQVEVICPPSLKAPMKSPELDVSPSSGIPFIMTPIMSRPNSPRPHEDPKEEEEVPETSVPEAPPSPSPKGPSRKKTADLTDVELLCLKPSASQDEASSILFNVLSRDAVRRILN